MLARGLAQTQGAAAEARARNKHAAARRPERGQTRAWAHGAVKQRAQTRGGTAKRARYTAKKGSENVSPGNLGPWREPTQEGSVEGKGPVEASKSRRGQRRPPTSKIWPYQKFQNQSNKRRHHQQVATETSTHMYPCPTVPSCR